MPEASVTFEDAKRCPFCQQPGNDRSQVQLPQGLGVMHLVFCERALCSMFGEPWFVQVRPDGTIPDRTQEQGPPDFAPRSREFESFGMRVVEDAVGRDLRDER